MTKTSVVVVFFLGAMITGMLTGVYIKTGQDLDPDDVPLAVAGSLCETLKSINLAYETCSSTYAAVLGVLFVLGLIGLVTGASHIGGLIPGLLIYVVGWLFGFGLVILR